METMRPRPGCDSISTLPDDVLVAILSLLPMKEAARTSVLSSRWKNLWKYIPRLNFAVDKSSLRTPRRLEYIKLVNAVVRSHKAPVLEEFRVCFDLTSDATEDLNNWLEYALSKQVQRLYFDLSGYYEKVYAFPEDILHRQSSRVGFDSLRSLSLIRVNVRSEVITHVLENSPFLERLVVHGSKSISELEVCGSDIKLKSLEVCHCSYLVLFKVCAPNLTKLKVTKLDGLLLDDVPKLTEVSIPLNFYKHDSYKTVYKYAISSVYKIAFISLSCCISQLESLALRSSRALKIMDHRVLPELSSLKKLTLVIDAFGNDSLLGLMSLIRASPKLEEFVLQLLWHRPHRSNRQVKMGTKSPHHCLKLVEFIGYNGRTSDCELVKSLIENCTALEKVIICPRPHYEPFKSKGLVEEEEIARGHAKQKLEGQVPDHIKLILL